jgi:hypothetical protein
MGGPPYPLYGIPHLGGIIASGSSLYVAAEWVPNVPFNILARNYLSWRITYGIATYDAVTGRLIGTAKQVFGYPPRPQPFGPAGMALSSTNYYVANYSKSSITKGGNLFFIKPVVNIGPAHPYALAVNGSVLYVTNNAQNSNGKFYISAYDANGGGLLNANLIEIATGGLNGLALQGNTLYVSVYSGSAPGVWTYDVSNPTQAQLIKGPLVSVNEPWGIAIEGNTLYVASYQDSMIYEFDATTGAQLSYSITVPAPTNITVEPATQPK